MEVPGKLVFCDLCKKIQNKSTEAEGLCAECEVFMCQGCFNGHLLQKICMNHALSPVGEGTAKQAQERIKMKNCKFHNKEIVKYYCRSHDAIACGDCVVVDHRQCKVDFIRDLANNLQVNSEYKNLISRIQQLEAEKEICNNKCKTNQNENTVLFESALQELRKFRKELSDYLDNAEKEIINEAKKRSEDNDKKMSDLEEKIASITHKISQLHESLDPKSCPDEILFTRLIECKPQVQQVEKTLSEIKGKTDIKTFTFVPAQSMKDILNQKPKIGCLKTDWQPASGEDVPTPDSEISKQEQANLSQERKAQLDTFEKSSTVGIESAVIKYMPPEDVPTPDSEISKHEQANLNQEPKAQLDTFEKSSTVGIESAVIKYMPPGKGCVHVNKSVNFSMMKKGLSKQEFGECAGCIKDAAKKGKPKSLMDHLEGATSGDYVEEPEMTIWVCLQCGNQGCGRNSPEKHALKHYETPRSSQHNVFINMSTWSAWCYDCDDELLPDKYKRVAECMEYIKKQASVPACDIAQMASRYGDQSLS